MSGVGKGVRMGGNIHGVLKFMRESSEPLMKLPHWVDAVKVCPYLSPSVRTTTLNNALRHGFIERHRSKHSFSLTGAGLIALMKLSNDADI